MEIALSFHSQKIVYYDHSICMVSWWGRDSYLNNEQIQARDVVLMNYEYGSS